MRLRHLLVSADIFTFVGEINDTSAENLITWLASRARSKNELTILLSTDGGSISAALAIHDMLRAVAAGGVRIKLVVVGECQSAGINVLMGVHPDCRFATVNARFMMHSVTYTNDQGTFEVDPYATAEQTAALIAELGHRYAEANELQKAYFRALKNSDLSYEQARLMTAKTTYFGAAQAKEYGMIHAIIDDTHREPQRPVPPLTRWARIKRRCRHPFRASLKP